jgi:hypothetical protein
MQPEHNISAVKQLEPVPELNNCSLHSSSRGWGLHGNGWGLQIMQYPDIHRILKFEYQIANDLYRYWIL